MNIIFFVGIILAIPSRSPDYQALLKPKQCSFLHVKKMYRAYLFNFNVLYGVYTIFINILILSKIICITNKKQHDKNIKFFKFGIYINKNNWFTKIKNNTTVFLKEIIWKLDINYKYLDKYLVESTNNRFITANKRNRASYLLLWKNEQFFCNHQVLNYYLSKSQMWHHFGIYISSWDEKITESIIYFKNTRSC